MYKRQVPDDRDKSIIEKNFKEQSELINPYIDFFYLDVFSSSWEVEIALDIIEKFNKPVLVGLHFKKNGKLLILEFSKPMNPIFSKLYDWYSFNILPRLGSMLANDSDSYKYLAESIRMHPDQERLKQMMQSAGFNECRFHNLLNGVVAIHIGYHD